MLTFIVLALWVLIFASLMIVPLLPKVDRLRALRSPHTVPEKKVVTLATSRTEHAA